jgi:HK97 family phage major capsid protein
VAEKTIQEQLTEISTALETKAAGDAKAAAEAAVTEVKSLLKEAETKATEAAKEATELKSEVKVLKDAADKNQQAFDTLMLKSKSVNGSNEQEAKSFNQILGEAIDRNIDEIKNFKRGARRFDMLPEVKANNKGEREVKTVGDMSITANFPNAGQIYQDVRPMIATPYNRVWLGDVLPGGTSDKPILTYPKENGGEGGAGLWEDPTTDKPEMDFDFTSANSAFKWLAGIVVVDREMLDDIPFLTAYIQQRMLISLKTAENAFILSGSDATKANPVVGLLAAATAFNGTSIITVERIIDAAFGQIVEDTEEFYNPTTVIARPREILNKVGFNKAAGSGEYDAPDNSISFGAGQLRLSGLELVTTTKMTANNFLTLDKSATMFVKRMAPELRLFEDSVLAKKNKVMFRIEERATLAIFNNKAIVKGLLTTP